MSSSLHNHSEFSLLDGFGHPKEYLDRAKEIGLKAFAITEHGNAYSWIYFDKLKKDYPEIKILYGCELYECFDMKVQDKNNKYFHLVALAKNEQGRIALNEIITKSNFEGFYFKPRVDLKLLKPYADNLIISSACLASKLSRESDYQKCIEYVNEYKAIFPYFYLEMQSHRSIEQREYNKKILKLATDTNTPFIITTDSHAPKECDLKYQNKLVQIAHDSDTVSESYIDCYMQSDDEIHAILDSVIGKENVDKGLRNTDIIADMIDDVSMPFQKPTLPTYPLPSGFNSNYDYLRYLCKKGWNTRNYNNLSFNEQQVRKDRLEYELRIIHQMGFDGYFLIVWDFINYARGHNQIVGDGRGSAAGSIVCYLLGISEIEPIENKLIFERFLNPERVSMPDIDTDVADRDSIINYLISKYGSKNVCQIINFSYITPIVAIKDTAKILHIPYAISDKISKSFTEDTFEKCLQNNPSILEDYAEYSDLFDIASKLSGRVKTVSTHAGGVGIVDTKITDYMPMKIGSDGEQVIQIDKRNVESIGIIKFDILGVTTLKIVQGCVEKLNMDYFDLNINNPIFKNDTKMYEVLKSANTDGVFQVESSGMKDLLKRLQPSDLSDVSAVLALYRPDSMSMLEDYIYYKLHPNEIKYWHKDLEPILKDTYGCIIYQEQIMDVVRVIGGRTYGGADIYRKAIGKKNIELVKSESAKLKQEIVDNGYSEELAETISSHFSKMGGYCFNKSHAVAYATLTLKTAYLKAHYPEYFFAELLTLKKTDYGAINKYIIDAERFNVKVLPPDINLSTDDFTVHNGNILFGLQAINGIGAKVVNAILQERNKNGTFKGMKDFLNRVNIGDSVIVSLVKAGCIKTKNKKKFLQHYFDYQFDLSANEYKPVSTLPKLSILRDEYNIDTDKYKTKEDRLRLYNIYRKAEYEINQQKKRSEYRKQITKKYLTGSEYWEFDALSIFLTGNPFKKGEKFITTHWSEIESNNSQGIVIGVVANIQKKKDKNKRQFAFVNMYSTDGLIEVVFWANQYKKYMDYIKKGCQLALLCKKSDTLAIVEEVKPYEDWLKIVQSNKT